MRRNGSGGRAAGLIYTCQARGHKFDSRCFPQIKDCMDNYSCLLYQAPYGKLSRIYVQTYISVK